MGTSEKRGRTRRTRRGTLLLLLRLSPPRIFFSRSSFLFFTRPRTNHHQTVYTERLAFCRLQQTNKQCHQVVFYFTEIPNFLTSEECDYVIKLAEENGLISSIARGGLTTKKDLEVPIVESMWLKAGVNMKAVF